MRDIHEVLTQNLTKSQYAAACDASDEVLTLACAGSGKSRTLAFRIARLVAEGERPDSIVAFTFTDKAAESIKLQVAKALSAASLDAGVLGAMYIGTIHSFCQGLISEMDAKYRQFDVLDENRLKLFLISRYPSLGVGRLRARANNQRYFETIREVSSAWQMLNDEMVRISEVTRYDPEMGEVLETLRAQLDRDEFIDFSLMIRIAAEALERDDPSVVRAVSNLKHLMVDEYQDVNPAQETLIRELHRYSATLFVVGDDDQSIYAWRGADVSNILTFTKRYPNCSSHTLSHNFRSTRSIVETADRFAAAELGAARIEKNPRADDPEGPRDFRRLWFETREDEAEWVADRIESLLGTCYIERDGVTRGLTPSDFAILMRSTKTNEQDGSPRHHAFSNALMSRDVPYTLEAGGGVFERPQVHVLRDAFELLRIASPTRSQALDFFTAQVLPAFPHAQFELFAQILSDWGRRIHTAPGGVRQRVYPQQLVHELLNAFGIAESSFDVGIMRDLGLFSRMIQDVETVYLSVDSPQRFGEILNFLQNAAESGYDTTTEDVLRRPDAVTISTIHKMKGLEFPVVFLVDMEAQRFPGRRRQYAGWLPAEVVQEAISRGAYHSTADEEARLFYTALTRAERYLYVSGAERLPGGRRQWRPSTFSQRLHDPEISTNSDPLPTGLTTCVPTRRIDDNVVPTSYTDVRYYLRCPKDYQFRKSFGFSPPIADLFGFGRTVHTAITKLHEAFPEGAPTGEQAAEIAKSVFHLKHVPPSRDPVNAPGPYERGRESASGVAKSYAEEFTDDFAQRRQVEARFEIPAEQAVISGSIDLMLREDDRGNVLEAKVIDFKTMEGGDSPEDNERLYWTELALQVQLYAKAAREILGENAETGSVHLLKDNQRVDVPVTSSAVDAAVENVEWAVARVVDGDFPMRPHVEKCRQCDFQALCPQKLEQFRTESRPPSIHIPGGQRQMARSFSEVDEGN